MLGQPVTEVYYLTLSLSSSYFSLFCSIPFPLARSTPRNRTSEQGGEKKATVESIIVSLVTGGSQLQQSQFNPRQIPRPETILEREDRDQEMGKVTCAVICKALSKCFEGT